METVPHIARLIDLKKMLRQKSFFLFGPRQTGKSWLIRETLADYRLYNLLNNETYLTLSRSLSHLREECGSADRFVIIDEIQKLPALLDEIHLLIEERGIHFLLTGSSARKLRRGGTNLLGGRARVKYLHPFSIQELKEQFDLEYALNRGLLPAIYFSEEADEDLKAYVGTYLKEEIAAEGLTRNVPAFSRFLEIAALCNGQLINFTKISNDAQVARTTVHEYFQILKDTLIAYEVPAWRKSKKRKAIGTSKFYLFDVGVARSLQNRGQVRKGSPEFGEMFETYVFHELKTYADYHGLDEICFWRSISGYEVDFVLDRKIAIEVKASKTVGKDDLKGLKALKEEKSFQKYLLICFEEETRHVDGIEVLPWKTFLERLWKGNFIKKA
ncbi:MAG: ATP-binding protein [Candidatus Omnitrophica bacterium]|nr:ATP-binding protein [Candidatus Omnitrophota bacterium]